MSKRKYKAKPLQQLIRKGAEPYWMQDIRCAQRRIEEARAKLRAAVSSGLSERK